jgi:hypothetical protein
MEKNEATLPGHHEKKHGRRTCQRKSEHIGALSIATAPPSEREFARVETGREGSSRKFSEVAAPAGTGTYCLRRDTQIVDNGRKPGFKDGTQHWYTRHHLGCSKSLIFRAFKSAVEKLQISLAAPFFYLIFQIIGCCLRAESISLMRRGSKNAPSIQAVLKIGIYYFLRSYVG